MGREDEISVTEVDEGDRVDMVISPHSYDKYGGRLTGIVFDAPDDRWKDAIEEGRRPMVDFAIRSDDDVVWRWNVDNGYVIGPVDHPERPPRSDIGRFRRFEVAGSGIDEAYKM